MNKGTDEFFAERKNFKGEYVEYDFRVKPFIRKDGKEGKTLVRYIESIYTKTRQCALCSRIGSPRTVSDRPDSCYQTEEFSWCHYSPLCMGCWNSVRSIKKKLEQCLINEDLIKIIAGRKKIMPEIHDTNSFRAFLCECIEKVKEGELDTIRALRIAQLSAQVNENLRIEISAGRYRLEQQKEVERLGRLPLIDERGNLTYDPSETQKKIDYNIDVTAGELRHLLDTYERLMEGISDERKDEYERRCAKIRTMLRCKL